MQYVDSEIGKDDETCKTAKTNCTTETSHAETELNKAYPILQPNAVSTRTKSPGAFVIVAGYAAKTGKLACFAVFVVFSQFGIPVMRL